MAVLCHTVARGRDTVAVLCHRVAVLCHTVTRGRAGGCVVTQWLGVGIQWLCCVTGWLCCVTQ